MAKRDKFKCSVCDKNHGYYKQLIVPPPSVITQMPEEEKADRLVQYDQFFVLDSTRIFLKGYFNIEADNEPSPAFSIEAWVEVKAMDFLSSREKLQAEESVTFNGELSVDIYLYPEMEGADIDVILDPAANDGLVYFSPIQDCQLKSDQGAPLSEVAYRKLMEKIFHAGELPNVDANL